MSWLDSMRPYGDNGFLISNVPEENIHSWESLKNEGLHVRAGLNSVLVTVEPHVLSLAEAVAILESIGSSADNVPTSNEIHTVPVSWGGDDLISVSQALKKTESDVISDMEGTVFHVALIGFAPGFPYLRPENGSPVSAWPTLSRLAVPRSSVPQGSVGVAAGMACIYPSSLPGGWNLLGATTQVLFDPTNDSRPSLLMRGERLRFVGGETSS